MGRDVVEAVGASRCRGRAILGPDGKMQAGRCIRCFDRERSLHSRSESMWRVGRVELRFSQCTQKATVCAFEGA
eukprot:3498790-Pyramimonas_sp.AAC.1